MLVSLNYYSPLFISFFSELNPLIISGPPTGQGTQGPKQGPDHANASSRI
jgi:hypothetical protein